MSQSPNLPGYIITERLGAGTYATVFKAYKTIGNRDVVAVKCILKSSLNNISKENLLTEIKILKELKYKYIVDMKDFQWDEKFVYILLEYCIGGDLRSYLDLRHSINEKTTQKFLHQLALALEFLHSHKVLHLDLKPSNILLSSQTNPTLKLADFGFAMSFSDVSNDTCLRGSLLYMAPEVYQKKSYDGKADLWSTGIILYECLFGVAPFYSNSIDELKQKINNSSPISLPQTPEISPECSDVLEGLLQRDPMMRINLHHFVTHPFVSANFVPSHEKIQKATELVTIGLKRESSGRLEDAIDLYCEAVRLYIQASNDEIDDKRKINLKDKALKFIERAEGLKCKLRPPVNQDSTIEKSAFQELVELSNSDESLARCIQLIQYATSLEEKDDYTSALSTYEKSIELLIAEISKTPNSQNKTIIKKETSRLLSRAEDIKKYLSINRRVEAANQDDANSTHCIVQ